MLEYFIFAAIIIDTIIFMVIPISLILTHIDDYHYQYFHYTLNAIQFNIHANTSWFQYTLISHSLPLLSALSYLAYFLSSFIAFFAILLVL